MKIIVFTIILTLCLGLLCACQQPVAPTEEPTQVTTQAPTEAATETPTEPPTETPTETPTEAGIDPMTIVGTWNFAYTEIEGEQVTDGDSTVTITGEDVGSLTVTFRDALYPDENFSDKALILEMQPVFEGCGNDQWQMRVDYIGFANTEYAFTVLDDGTLMMQNFFYIDDMPMVSYRFFTKN